MATDKASSKIITACMKTEVSAQPRDFVHVHVCFVASQRLAWHMSCQVEVEHNVLYKTYVSCVL